MSWQLVTTAPNAEMRVSRMLACLDFEHRVYRFRRKTAFQGKVVERLAPLFPRYIFIKAIQCWDLIRSITGVVDFVRRAGAIVDVDARDLERLSSTCDAEHVLIAEPYSSSRFRSGEKVRVIGTQSLVFGTVGFYHCPVNHEKAVVLLPWFNGQLTQTVVDEADLERYEALKTHRTRGRRRRKRNRRHIPVEAHSTA